MKKKIAIVTLVILMFLVTFVGGTVYWLFLKAKSIARSAVNISGESTTAPQEEVSTMLSMPVKDTPGQDLEKVPRYNGAIRTNYYVSEDKNFTSVGYIAPVSAETLFSYHKNYLQPQNWTRTSSDQKTANYTSEGYELTIEIIAENSSPVLTKYSLNLTKISF